MADEEIRISPADLSRLDATTKRAEGLQAHVNLGAAREFASSLKTSVDLVLRNLPAIERVLSIQKGSAQEQLIEEALKATRGFASSAEAGLRLGILTRSPRLGLYGALAAVAASAAIMTTEEERQREAARAEQAVRNGAAALQRRLNAINAETEAELERLAAKRRGRAR